MGKGELEFHTALKRKYISDIFKQILGHLLQHSNSEIKWVSQRNTGLLLPGGNVQWTLSHFQMRKGPSGACPQRALSAGACGCLLELTGARRSEDCFVQ